MLRYLGISYLLRRLIITHISLHSTIKNTKLQEIIGLIS